MGVSTDGILCFGVEFYDPEEGKEEPTIEGMQFNEWYEANWCNDEIPADLITHCHREYPMYILALRNRVSIANRGFPEHLEPEQLIVPDEDIQVFKEWCEKAGVEYKEPKWILCSLWG